MTKEPSSIARDAGRGRGPGGGLFRTRWLIYAAVVIALLALRLAPGLAPRIRSLWGGGKQERPLVVAGLDLAPRLIPRIVDEYEQLYPQVSIRVLGGGTKHALEDLLNRRADVAFLSRPLTPDEAAIARSVGDSAMTSYPVALGGIAVLAAADAPIDSIRVEDLRDVIMGGRPNGLPLTQDGPARLYAPDPNLGLWTALVDQLELPDTSRTSVFWLADDTKVGQAVARDPRGLGFASTLALPPDLGRWGVRALPVVGARTTPASEPNQGAVAAGEYPLFHYLYMTCRPDCGVAASGFISFMYSGRGQRLIAREGYLPAREVPREIQLTSRPIGSTG